MKDQPAFPQHLIETRDGAFQCSYDAPDGAGITMRDYFAAKALCGLIASYAVPGVGLPNAEIAAQHSYEYADAMLKEREK